MRLNNEQLRRNRLGLWLGGSLLLHVLAVHFLDLHTEGTRPSIEHLQVTLLGVTSPAIGAREPPRGVRKATVSSSPVLPAAPTPEQEQGEPIAATPATITPAVKTAVERAAKQRLSATEVRKDPPIKVVRKATQTAFKPSSSAQSAATLANKQAVPAAEPTTTTRAGMAPASASVGNDGANATSAASASEHSAPRNNSGEALADAAGHAAFMRLLHAAIDHHKRYPRLARRQRREGVATVLFRLHPDGVLDNLTLDDSSGFAALDDAALRAVAAVAPFAPATKFLTRETRFRVGVEFHLY